MWTFFCECGEPGCNALVSLAFEEFDQLAVRGIGTVRADRHVAAANPRKV